MAIALGAGFGAATSQRTAVGAAVHCTRYHPPTQIDVYCSQTAYFSNGTCLPGWCWYQTSSTAFRDDNWAQWENTQSWSLWYDQGYSYDKVTGTSQTAMEGSGGAVYAYALCGFENSPVSFYNDCSTDWHN